MEHTNQPERASFERWQQRREQRRKREKRHSVISISIIAVLLVAALGIWRLNSRNIILEVNGTAMEPALFQGDRVLCKRNAQIQRKDLVAFYYEDQLLIKRVIAGPGQKVNIMDDGSVYVDGVKMQEPYAANVQLGQCDRDFPYVVPEGEYFVLSDDRSNTVDSRYSGFGCVSQDQIIGKITRKLG